MMSANNISTLFIMSLFSVSSIYANDGKPNVIIIYTDDQGTLDLGCYGATDLHTPNIDNLAQNGIRFTQFYGAPVSSVSRASLLSGQFSKRAGLITNAGGENGLPSEKETIAERMKRNGYNTALIGKWHLGDSFELGPNNQGFDYFWGFRGGCIDNYSHFYYWGGPNRHDLWENECEIYCPGSLFIDKSLVQLKSFVKQQKESPFFIYWAVNMPHYPLQPKEKWLEYYSALPNPRRMYAAFMSTLDEYIGELYTFLKSENLLENTIIIFQSDNGHSLELRTFNGGGYAGEYRGGKFSMFEAGIRVPAIISWNGNLPEGEVREQLAMNVDWFPTLVELCGLNDDNMEVDGKSLCPILDNSSADSPHSVLHFDFGNQYAVRSGDWKLIVNPREAIDGVKLEKMILTNLREDPKEEKNYVESNPEKVDELLKLREQYINSL